jgi:hypothetical protein
VGGSVADEGTGIIERLDLYAETCCTTDERAAR